MRQPKAYGRAPHAMWADRWNPYRKREYVGHMMSPAYFNALLECDEQGKSLRFDVEYEGHGCIDAPEEIPAGSTLRVRTVGGYEREEYNRMPRGQTDWKEAMGVLAEVAMMLKEVLNGQGD